MEKCDHEVPIEIYGRDKICIIEILIPMLIQYKLQPHPDKGSCYLRGPKFCMEYFFASTVVRLVRAIVEVWGASWDVMNNLWSFMVQS